jgi:hypothetical protein
MENIDDEELERLQVDLNLRLDNPDGETEEERDESRKRTIEEISDLISEVKCRKRMKAHATALASTAGGGRAATTIVTEAANKIFCKDLSAASISRWADQLVDHQVRLQRSHTFDQIKLMLSETDRLEISQTLKSFRFADGASIKDAANWTKWEDNQGLADILKLVYPKSEAISDVQRIVALQFRIFWVKNARHFLPFVAQAQQALSWEDRLEEFSALSPQRTHYCRMLSSTKLSESAKKLVQ